MVVEVEVEMSSTNLALDHTVQVVPDIRIDIASSAFAPSDQSKLLIGIQTSDRNALRSALSEDQSILNARLINESAKRFLYQIRWVESVQQTLRTLTSGTASLYSGRCRNGTWILQLWLPARNGLHSLSEHWDKHDLEITIRSIRSDGYVLTDTGSLTNLQYETLVTAYRLGYFDVPRKVTMTELADRFGVTQQTVSERLRRGHQQLIMDKLLFDTG